MAQALAHGINFFHIRNMPVGQAIIRAILMASGFNWRGRRNADKVVLTRSSIRSPHVLKTFNGFRTLQISDLHVTHSGRSMARESEIAESLDYDMCLLAGDCRAKAWGLYGQSIAGAAKIRAALKGPALGLFGNRDMVHMHACCRAHRHQETDERVRGHPTRLRRN